MMEECVLNGIIRNEEEKDYFEVETVTREAFWNVYRPGCNEHLVTHNFRSNPAFVKELDYVIEQDCEIVGTIIYTLGDLTLDTGQRERFLTFGPIAIRPDKQGRGLGGELIRFTLQKARNMGFKAVFITGNPDYYRRFGFESACKYSIYLDENRDANEATFFMVNVLEEGALDGKAGIFQFDKCFSPSDEELEEFEKLFPPKVKEKRPGQIF